MSEDRLRQLLVVASAALALAMTGCTTSSPQVDPSPSPTTPSTSSPPVATTSPDASAPRRGGSLRIALSRDPASLDPALATGESGQQVVDALFDSLTRVDARQQAVPDVAQSWTVSPDQRTWTFRIAPGQTFHDGTPVTADDFVRAFNRITDGTRQPRSFLAYLLEPVQGWAEAQAAGTPLAGVRVGEEGELVITLDRPEADLPSLLAHPALGPVPVQADESPSAFSEEPVGNGAFRMAEPWAHDQFIRLSRADDRALLDEVLFRIYSGDADSEQQWADFAADQLHVARVPATQRRAALASHGAAGDGSAGPGYLDGPLATIYAYALDLSRPPFDEAVVRRALSLLLDREAIATEVMLDTRRPADALVPPGVLGHRAGSCTWCLHDPELAATLLAENEVDLDPEVIGPVVLLHQRTSSDARVAAIVAEAIRNGLGLEVEVRELAPTPMAQAIANGEPHLHRTGWVGEQALPATILPPLFHSREVGRDNVTGFVDPEVDALLDQAAGTAALADRLAIQAAAEDRIVDALPIVPLLTYEVGLVVADDVRGLRVDPTGRTDLAAVWLAP